MNDWAKGLLSDETDDAALALAIEAGGWPELPPADRRAFALVVRASLDAQAEGATRLRLDTTEARLVRLGAGDDDRARAGRLAAALAGAAAGTGEIPAALRPVVGRPGDYVPFVLDAGCLYHERVLRLETRLGAALTARLAAGEIPVPPAQLAAAVAAAGSPERRWTGAQQAAIEAALGRRLAVVSGGPGTGKTAVISGIIRAWRALGLPAEAIAVAAPTGKAANRIAELLPADAPQPTTLHRLLGAGGGRATTRSSRFRHHENHPLPYAAVVVDEASMVGLVLMEQLVRALAPETRLVLVGDADQLPAVEAGSVFRDLAPLAVRLRESHRMDPSDPAGAAVLDAARAIAAGDLGARGTPPASHPAELPAAGFACLDSGPAGARGPARSTTEKARRQLSAFLDHWRALHLRPAGEASRSYRVGADGQLDLEDEGVIAALLDHHRRRRILTVTRVGPTGAEAINRTLDQRAAQEASVPAETSDGIRPGTPVLMTANDHERGLYNGDSGIVVRLTDSTNADAGRTDRRWLAAVFPRAGGLVPFPLAGLRGMVEIAYASTVHKAQGSELDYAALVLPETDLPLCTRELIYTAVTRVRRSIVVVGRRPILELAIRRPLERASGLADRLALPTAPVARPG